jgi:hypothetical protein
MNVEEIMKFKNHHFAASSETNYLNRFQMLSVTNQVEPVNFFYFLFWISESRLKQINCFLLSRLILFPSIKWYFPLIVVLRYR